MKSATRRPIRAYLIHALWISMTIFYAARNSSYFGRLTLILLAGLGTVSFISILIRRNYFEIRENKLLIHKEFFRTQKIDIKDISRVEIEPGPFAASKIYLKNGTHIKYLDQMVNEKDVKALLEPFNIPVE